MVLLLVRVLVLVVLVLVMLVDLLVVAVVFQCCEARWYIARP